MERRERKKKKIKNDIATNAKKLFLARGYTGTTLEDIANASDYGIGTFYNYYNSKGDIFLEIMTNELKNNSAVQEYVPLNTETSIADLTLAFIWNLAQPLQIKKKEMWRELISVAMGSIETDTKLLQRLSEYDSQFVEQLKELFDDQKSKGALSSSFPPETSAKVIFNIVLASFMFYLYDPETNLEELRETIREQVHFIFESWEV